MSTQEQPGLTVFAQANALLFALSGNTRRAKLELNKLDRTEIAQMRAALRLLTAVCDQRSQILAARATGH